MEIDNLVRMVDSSGEYYIGCLNKHFIHELLINININILDDVECITMRAFNNEQLSLNKYNLKGISLLFLTSLVKINIIKEEYRGMTYYYKDIIKIKYNSTFMINEDLKKLSTLIKIICGYNNSTFTTKIIPFNNGNDYRCIINENIKKLLLKYYNIKITDINKDFKTFSDIRIAGMFVNKYWLLPMTAEEHKHNDVYIDNNNFLAQSIDTCISYFNDNHVNIFVDKEYNISILYGNGNILDTKIINKTQIKTILMMAKIYNSYYNTNIDFDIINYKYYDNITKQKILTIIKALKVSENSINRKIKGTIKLGKPLFTRIINLSIFN